MSVFMLVEFKVHNIITIFKFINGVVGVIVSEIDKLLYYGICILPVILLVKLLLLLLVVNLAQRLVNNEVLLGEFTPIFLLF